MSDGAAASRAGPRTSGEIFRAFNRLALQGFGGVLPVAQRELVERRGWLTRDEFLQALSVAQVLPGPNIINLGLMIGDRYLGWRGAVAAVAGLLLVPLAIVITAAALYGRLATEPAVAGALRGMGAVAAGLIVATGCKLAPALRGNPLGAAACAGVAALTFVAVGWLRWPLVAVVLGLGVPSVALAWRRLGEPTGPGRPPRGGESDGEAGSSPRADDR